MADIYDNGEVDGQPDPNDKWEGLGPVVDAAHFGDKQLVVFESEVEGILERVAHILAKYPQVEELAGDDLRMIYDLMEGWTDVDSLGMRVASPGQEEL